MKTLMTACIGALVALPPVAFAQTATTPAETPAATQSETTPAPTGDAATTTTTPAPVATDAATLAPPSDPATMDDVEYVTTEATGSLYTSDLVGQSVYGVGDEKVGDINDLLMDESGNIEAVVIGVGGFIGLGEKDVAVTLESLTISATDTAYRISIRATEQNLEEAPTFNRADGTSSDRLGAFERAYTRTRVEAEKALDEASRQAKELYEQGRQAVNDLTKSEDTTTETTPAQ